MHHICTLFHKHLSVKVDCLEVVAATLIEDSTCFKGTFFLTNFETLVDREVAARYEVDNLVAMSLLTQNVNEDQQELIKFF